MTRKFGPHSDDTPKRLATQSSSQLTALGVALLNFTSPDEVRDIRTYLTVLNAMTLRVGA